MPRPLPALLLVFLLPAAALGYSQGFNCGDNKSRTAADGVVYAADRVYNAGNGAGHIGGESYRPGLFDSVDDIGGVDSVTHRRMLGSRLEGWREYRFDLPSGDYVVHLHLLENFHHWRGLRSFSIAAEDGALVLDLDIFAEVDRRYALALRRAVGVTDGQLNVRAAASIDQTCIQGIYVESYTDDATPPPVPTNLVALPSYREALLLLERPWATDELGVHIWRTDLSAGGPEERITEEPLLFDRHRDRGLVPGHQYRYRLSAVDAGGNESDPSAPVLVTPLGAGDSILPVRGFDMAEPDFVTLYTQRGDDDYLPALVWADGELWPDAELRLRGNTTRSLTKKNYKARTSAGDLFPGNRIKWNLQSEWQMPSPLREKLGFEYFAIAGAHASAAEYVNLERGDEYLGVYVDIEQVDKYFLQNRGLSATVWRADSEEAGGDFTRKPRLELYYPIYTLEHGRYADYADLDELFRVVNESSPEEFRTAIRQVVDIDSFMRFYSVQALLSNWDHVVHNYFLIRDHASGLFHFAPWDVQLGWDDVRHPIDYGTRDHRWFFLFYNRLYENLMSSPQYARIYAATLGTLLRDTFPLDAVQSWIADDHALVRPDVERDMHKPGYEDLGLFDGELAYLQQFMDDRRANIIEQLRGFAPHPTVNLFVNELMRWNLSGIVDEALEHEPWVEIHNFGTETIGLEGIGLSRDPDEPHQWTFPAGAEIGPGAHLVVWLDGEPLEGPLHTSFRAGTGLQLIYLSRADGTPIDALAPGMPAFPDVPDARTPDAGAQIIPVAAPTPGSANDPRPAVELLLEGARDYLPGDEAAVEIALVNHTPVAVDGALAVTLLVGAEEIELEETAIHLDPGGSLGERVELMVPPGAPALRATVRAELRESGGHLLSSQLFEVRVWDGRPIPLVINELMADNDTTVADPNDQFEDWVEIHNPSERSVPLEGLYLSDDASDPTKWAFPQRSIASGEYLIVWCDDDEDQGPLHTPFKLSAAGEELGLYDLDVRGNAAIDYTAFGDLSDDRVWGRSPDGIGEFSLLPRATPGAPNP